MPLLIAALLVASAQGQYQSTPAPSTKSVLNRYKDRNCQRLDSGQGSVQSWTRVVGGQYCYELTKGLHCGFRCHIRLRCEFDTHSGIMVDEMDDDSCQQSAVKSTGGFAMTPHLYWLEARGLFRGDCVSDGNGKFVRFENPAIAYEHFPNCEQYGAVMPGVDATAYLFTSIYTLQFYADLACQEPYVVDTYSDRPTSAYEWRLYRGAQYCYDMVDATPRPNGTPVSAEFDILNWQMACGNQDLYGNGIMVAGFSDPKCGGRSTQAQKWKDVFYPMNFPGTMDLLRGRCTIWGKYRVKFDRAFDTFHYPDCESWSCKDGPCSGGRVRDSSDRTGQVYDGSIRTSGGDPADARSLWNVSASGTAALEVSRVFSAVLVAVLWSAA